MPIYSINDNDEIAAFTSVDLNPGQLTYSEEIASGKNLWRTERFEIFKKEID